MTKNLTSLLEQQRPRAAAWEHLWGWPAVFLIVAVAPAIIFVLLPWPVEGKSLAVLHGLCAQQPTHSFYFGESRLPFDARMTGIYGGFAITCLFLFVRGRWRVSGIPPTHMMILFAGFVVLLGIDGFNSTLKDMQVWYPYEPSNVYRIFTGLLTGTTLAIFVWILVGQSGFARHAQSLKPILHNYRELSVLLGIQFLCALIVLTNWSPLRIPITAMLLISAVAALTGLMMSFILLMTRRENEAIDTWQLARPATLALLMAFGIMGLMGGGRFALENIFGLPATIDKAAMLLSGVI